jgi:hypothetical protein
MAAVTPDVTADVPVRMLQGGATLQVASGGTIQVINGGQIEVMAGGATDDTAYMRATGNLNVQVVAAGNGNGADTTDDVLMVFTLKAGALDVAGRQVNILATGKTGATGNNKQFKIYWGCTSAVVGSAVSGGTAIAASGVVTTNNGGWQASAQVTKYGAAGSNTQIAQGATIAGATHGGVNAPVSLTAAENADIIIAVTGASGTTGAANDVLCMMLDVSFSD